MKRILYIALVAVLMMRLGAVSAAAADGTGKPSDIKRKGLPEVFAMAEAEERVGRTSRALSLYNAAGERYFDAMSDADRRLCASSYYRMAEICTRKRQYSVAMNRYLDALRISDRFSYANISAQIYIGIGNLYSSHADYQMGIRYYKQALAIVEKSGDRHAKNSVLNNLVGASCFAQRTDEGKKYLAALQRSRENTHDYAYNLLMCKGLVASFGKRPQDGVVYYKQALAYVKKNRLSDAHYESVCSCLAQLYLDLAQPDSAIAYLKENERKSLRTGHKELMMETMRSLSLAYKNKGNNNLAAVYRSRYVDLADSLYNDEEQNSMKTALFLYETKKSEDTISELTMEKQSRDKLIAIQRAGITALVVVFGIFALLLVIVYRQKKQLYTAYRELYTRSLTYIGGGEEESGGNGDHSVSDGCGAAAADSMRQVDAPSSRMLTAEQRDALVESIASVMGKSDVYCDSDFSIDTLAVLVGSNSRYVSEAINDKYGKNFRTFLNEYRVREAMRRLADTERYGGYTIKAISEGVGYKSQANFITQFTKLAGMKPSIYQKMSKMQR